MLDPLEQRILGVLIEKEATVPDTYPLTENALRMGCNQSNNRDPVMELRDQDMVDPLRSLLEKSWVARIDGGGRSTKWRHKAIERVGLTKPELCVLCELLLRGPQAPGALKPRVQRLGVDAEPTESEAILIRLASRPEPLVAQLPLGPRERDRRWAHRLAGDPLLRAAEAEGSNAPIHAPSAVASHAEPVMSLEARVVRLEQQVAELAASLREITDALK